MPVKGPSWGFLEKSKFIASYVFFKFKVVNEVKTHKSDFLIYEIKDSWQNALNAFRKPKFSLKWVCTDKIQTRFGLFKVRKHTQDATVASPAFERIDFNNANLMLDILSKDHEKVFFVDVGANIGKYTVGLNYKKRNNVKTISFEPDPENFRMLTTNCELNSMDTSSIFQKAIGQKKGTTYLNQNRIRPWDQGTSNQGGQISVECDSLDNHFLLPNHDFKGNALLIKIDTDGFEEQVLNGAKRLFLEPSRIEMIIEDVCQRDLIYSMLSDMGFTPVKKLTPFNSWWSKKNH